MDPFLRSPLKSLAAADALGRLKAVAELRRQAHDFVDEVFLEAELAQVRVARSTRPPESWEKIGDAIGGLSKTQAIRRYKRFL